MSLSDTFTFSSPFPSGYRIQQILGTRTIFILPLKSRLSRPTRSNFAACRSSLAGSFLSAGKFWSGQGRSFDADERGHHLVTAVIIARILEPRRWNWHVSARVPRFHSRFEANAHLYLTGLSSTRGIQLRFPNSPGKRPWSVVTFCFA